MTKGFSVNPDRAKTIKNHGCPTPHKLWFNTKKEARTYLKDYKKTLSNADKLSIYKCNGCECYHFTTMKKSTSRKIKNRGQFAKAPELVNAARFAAYIKH